MANETENQSTSTSPVESRGFPALVARIVDEYTVVINRGSDDGIQKGHNFLIYGIEDEVIDPETGESLGCLEVVRGRGSVTHVQPRMATIKASQRSPSKVIKKKGMGVWALGAEVIEESNEGTIIPFEEAIAGDHAKPL